MITPQLISPKSIVVVGASNDIHKPGGKILKNLIDGNFDGPLYVVNPNTEQVQGINSYSDIKQLPECDLAILAIQANKCLPVIKVLVKEKNTKAFIIISAGFSELNDEGVLIEKSIADLVNQYNATLIGPNCIGIVNQNYDGVFTLPVPKIDPHGCDLLSGSGATAVFIMESGLSKGLTFSGIYTVGNSAQTGIEELLEYMDENYDPENSSKVKLLYIESIKDPDKLLKHASSLIRKGCRIAAIKSGASEAGRRAASSHTGAIMSSDAAVEALFRKAGIVRCFGREELTTVASVLMHKPLQGKNIAIITHAGGPGVMLTDALSNGGLTIPKLSGLKADALLAKLHPGASVENPIDLLATGTAEQLGAVIDYCEYEFPEIDGMIVIFGSPGLTDVFDAYTVLHQKMKTCCKPIFPILPSIITARKELDFFISKGHSSFPDEVQLGSALTKVFNTPKPAEGTIIKEGVNIDLIRKTIDEAPAGFANNDAIMKLLHAAGIPYIRSDVATNHRKLMSLARDFGFPLVLKAVGPIHKTDINGVVLNVHTKKHLVAEFNRLMKIKDCTGVMVQPMIKGTELFVGASYEPNFGHVVLFGLGGIFVEVLHDVSSGLAPLTYEETNSMIKSIKSYDIIEGTRGKEGVNEKLLNDILVRLSTMLRFTTEINEIDLNPLIAYKDEITVVDARVLIKK